VFFGAILGAGSQFGQSCGLVSCCPQRLGHDFSASIVIDGQ
jgi:hypothetical protein